MNSKRRIRVITLGCSKNDVDTEHLLSCLPDSDFEFSREDGSEAVDVLLINTCGFIGDAKQESIDCILANVERKQRGLIGKIAVFGCLSQRYAAELPALIPEVDAWFGARKLNPVLRYLGVSGDADASTARRMLPSPYAYLKISEGCNRRCSYCAIPSIRGRHRSVPVETLVEEATGLAAGGVKELLLIAQDSTWYGLDLYGKRELGRLLDALSEVEGIERLRIHYSHPDGFPVDVLERMASNPKVCRYLDIPLQHISDKVLRAMHRHVSGNWTRELVQRLRREVPGVALRTTIIVGHPGEGEAEFDELLDFLREARFERLGAFAYSEEEGTWGASHLPDSIAPEEKQRRLDALMSLQRSISREINEARIGTTARVLVDGYSDGLLVCRSEFESPEVDGEILVGTEGLAADPATLIGSFLDVRITSADEYDLSGQILA